MGMERKAFGEAIMETARKTPSWVSWAIPFSRWTAMARHQDSQEGFALKGVQTVDEKREDIRPFDDWGRCPTCGRYDWMLKHSCPLSSMQELIQALARDRHKEAEYKQEAKRLQAVFMATPDGQKLAEIRSKLPAAREDINRAVKAVQKAALEAYKSNGKKRVHKAVIVKLYTTLEYDLVKARHWARKSLPSALKLDVRAFEKAAKAIDFDFVEKLTEPRVKIARDLSEFLLEDSNG